MIKQFQKSVQTYVTPDVSVIEIQVEGCLASSIPTVLRDMENNGVYDESF